MMTVGKYFQPSQLSVVMLASHLDVSTRSWSKLGHNKSYTQCLLDECCEVTSYRGFLCQQRY